MKKMYLAFALVIAGCASTLVAQNSIYEFIQNVFCPGDNGGNGNG